MAPKAPRTLTVRTSAGENWTQPIPEQICREMDVCFAIDILGAALLEIRTDKRDATTSLSKLPADASAATLRAVAETQVARLLEMIERLDSTGQDVIDAVKIMLVV